MNLSMSQKLSGDYKTDGQRMQTKEILNATMANSPKKERREEPSNGLLKRKEKSKEIKERKRTEGQSLEMKAKEDRSLSVTSCGSIIFSNDIAIEKRVRYKVTATTRTRQYDTELERKIRQILKQKKTKQKIKPDPKQHTENETKNRTTQKANTKHKHTNIQRINRNK
ncbi:hypothetical protein WN51_03997 [Melipona quadrifasciata]|uniref:Uncharacterized protein n=1 Tax=Melipona quadrifasciata TaxID=166423 RepID=A0A0N0BC52_9HYME|nr:hypothetical protein WN51_03997 [Melipona quadrifasciata]